MAAYLNGAPDAELRIGISERHPQGQRFATLYQVWRDKLASGFAQRKAGSGRDERADGEHRGRDDPDDERRMTAERQPARHGSLSGRRSRVAAAP